MRLDNVLEELVEGSTVVEDVSAKITINSSYYQSTSGASNLAVRVGNIVFLYYRLTATAAATSGATNIPMLRLPHRIRTGLGGILYRLPTGTSSNITRPLIRFWNDSSTGFGCIGQSWTSSGLKSGDLMEFWCAYVPDM